MLVGELQKVQISSMELQIRSDRLGETSHVTSEARNSPTKVTHRTRQNKYMRTYPRAISKLLISFLIFQISTFLSDDVSSLPYVEDIAGLVVAGAKLEKIGDPSVWQWDSSRSNWRNGQFIVDFGQVVNLPDQNTVKFSRKWNGCRRKSFKRMDTSFSEVRFDPDISGCASPRRCG